MKKKPAPKPRTPKPAKPPKAAKPRKARQPKAPPPPKPARDRRPLLEGEWLLAALAYVLKACPKDGLLACAADGFGERVVSSHNDVMALTVFVPKDVRWDYQGSVTRSSARECLAWLRAMRPTRVEVNALGHVTMHAGAQPEVVHKLVTGTLPVGWQPPRPGDVTGLPLRIPASSLKLVQSWPGCTVKATQHTDCTLRVDVHGGDGQLVARAVLVEEGGRLFPVDARQTEVKGTESVATKAATTPTLPAPPDPPKPPAPTEAERLEALRTPAEAPEREPARERGSKDVCLWVPADVWDSLDADGVQTLQDPKHALHLVWSQVTHQGIAWRTTACHRAQLDHVVRAAAKIGPGGVRVLVGDEPRVVEGNAS